MRPTRREMILLTGAAALAAGRARAQQAAQPQVNLGLVPSGDFINAIVANEKGFFAEDGMPTRLTVIPLIGDIPAGLLSNSMQIGVTTGPTFLQAVAGGLDLVAVSGGTRFSPDRATASLLVPPDSPITGPQDLAGKRVGVPGVNSLLDLLFRRWLILHKVDWHGVREIEVSFPQMADLLRGHQLDAAIVKEPFTTKALESGAAKRVANYVPEVDPHGLNVFWIATRAWADAHRQDIAAFRKGLDQGTEFYLHNPEGRAIEQKVLHTTTTVIPFFDTKITPQDLQFEEELAKQFGLIQGNIDVSKLIV